MAASYSHVIAILSVSPKVKLFVNRGDNPLSTTFVLVRYPDARSAEVEDDGQAKKIELDLSRLRRLLNSVEKMDGDIANGVPTGREHLGGNIYLTFSSDFVGVRQFYFHRTRGDVFPTKEGVSLTHQQWSTLKGLLTEVENVHAPELKDYVPCSSSPNHDSQITFLRCGECSPNSLLGW